MDEIKVLKENYNVCSPNCEFALIDFVDGDSYAFVCFKYSKPLGWFPNLQRLEECKNDTEKEKPA